MDPETIVALVGPPGAGKTTLLKILVGLVPYWVPEGIMRVLSVLPKSVEAMVCCDDTAPHHCPGPMVWLASSLTILDARCTIESTKRHP